MTAQPPDPEALKQGIAGVFDRSAETYDQVGVDFFTPPAHDLVAQAALREGERVLDVGTGRGAVVFAAASAVGASGHVVGIDLSAKMAELAQAEVGARGLANVTVAQGDAERPDFADGSFDAVLASLVMFFLPEPAVAVRRYAALLAPGGRFGFTTFGAQDPNFDAAMRAVSTFVPGGMPPRDERQGPFGSREGITQLVTANGFARPEIDEMTYESRFTDPDHWLAWVWSHGGRYALERVPADRFDEAIAAAKIAFEAARTSVGDYAIHTQIRFAVARLAQA
jgi:ubiquinone/menaquinone biosynthesis C-methylase UbiE